MFIKFNSVQLIYFSTGENVLKLLYIFAITIWVLVECIDLNPQIQKWHSNHPNNKLEAVSP